VIKDSIYCWTLYHHIHFFQNSGPWIPSTPSNFRSFAEHFGGVARTLQDEGSLEEWIFISLNVKSMADSKKALDFYGLILYWSYFAKDGRFTRTNIPLC